MEIMTWDIESRGLFGKIFLIGFYDGNSYKEFTNLKDFIEEIKTKEGLIYAHNHEFDLLKVIQEFKGLTVNINKSLIINGKFVSLEFKEIPNLVFRDSMKIIPGSLEKITKSFGVATPKMDLEKYIKEKGYKDKGDFFERVPVNDPVVKMYLEADCVSLYQVLAEIMTITGLTDEDFKYIITTAGLAMRLFKTGFEADYTAIVSQKLSKETRDFYRQAYTGGRVEVVQPLADKGNAYDVNSLYPYVMLQDYPVGRFQSIEKPKLVEKYWKLFLKQDKSKCIIDVTVSVPDRHIPALPKKGKNKLFFPVGEYRATYVGDELKYAVEKHGVKIDEYHKMSFYPTSRPVFHPWVDTFYSLKSDSSGAKKQFAKLMLNSLYGKFGQREIMWVYSSEKPNPDKIKHILSTPLKVSTRFGKFWQYKRKRYSEYIQPQIAAHVTAYARLELLKQIDEIQEQGGKIFYYDTDSIMTDIKISKKKIDPKKIGYWSLDAEFTGGIFLQPKVYIFKDTSTGKEKVRQKGVPKQYMFDRQKFNLAIKKIKKGDKTLTVFKSHKKVPSIMAQLKQEKILKFITIKKKINLDRIQKRQINFEKNITTAHNWQELPAEEKGE